MSQKYATLKDVAAEVGLSKAQVARALRGDPGVKSTTRAQVEKVAQAMGYRANIAARNLASARSTIVGLVIGEPMNPFHIQLAQAIDRELADAGLEPIISLRAVDDRSALREADRLISMRAAGAILIGTPHGEKTIIEMATCLPCVYLGKHIDHPAVSTVSVDDGEGVGKAMEYLIAAGHRHIAHITANTEAAVAERLSSYIQAMRSAGLEPVVHTGGSDANAGRTGVDALLQRSPRPTAILAYNDFIAVGVINRLHGLGLRVPEDMSVIGFDDIPAAASETLSITTLRQDPEYQACRAVEALLTVMREPEGGAQKIVLPVELKLRRSVLPVRHTN